VHDDRLSFRRHYPDQVLWVCFSGFSSEVSPKLMIVHFTIFVQNLCQRKRIFIYKLINKIFSCHKLIAYFINFIYGARSVILLLFLFLRLFLKNAARLHHSAVENFHTSNLLHKIVQVEIRYGVHPLRAGLYLILYLKPAPL